MYQLLLVDDERLVLDGLQEYIDWEALGFHVAGTAQNVADALAVIHRQRIDVLLSDIVMEKETGFDLVRKAHEDFPALKFVVLSGYGEFSFALEAIQLGCVNYLTKPVDFGQCADVFQKLRHTLDSEQAAQSHQIDLYQLKREKFFRLFLETGEGESQFFTYFPDGAPLYGVVILHFSRGTPAEHIQGLDKRFRSFLSRYLFALSPVDFCLVLAQLSTPGDCLLRLEKICSSNLPHAYLSLGGLSADYRALPRLFRQATEALKYRHLRKRGQVLQYDQLDSLFLASKFDYGSFEKRIAQALMEKDYNGASEFILSRAARFLDGEPDLAGLTNILLSLNRILAAQGLEPYQSDYDSFRRLVKTRNTDEAADCLAEFVRGSIEQIRIRFPDSGNYIINAALEYINTHLDEKLTLAALSEVVYVTPTYFSRLFHKVVGTHFADYLAGLRIERSKALLPDPSLKIYDIATLVGYDNAKHFSKVFQELTGITPSEYRAGTASARAAEK